MPKRSFGRVATRGRGNKRNVNSQWCHLEIGKGISESILAPKPVIKRNPWAPKPGVALSEPLKSCHLGAERQMRAEPEPGEPRSSHCTLLDCHGLWRMWLMKQDWPQSCLPLPYCPPPSLLAPDGGEDGGAPGGRSQRPAGSAGGVGLELAPGALQPDPRPPRRRRWWAAWVAEMTASGTGQQGGDDCSTPLCNLDKPGSLQLLLGTELGGIPNSPSRVVCPHPWGCCSPASGKGAWKSSTLSTTLMQSSCLLLEPCSWHRSPWGTGRGGTAGSSQYPFTHPPGRPLSFRSILSTRAGSARQLAVTQQLSSENRTGILAWLPQLCAK